MSVGIYMTDPPQSGASPLPHLDLHKVWRPCTASMHHEPASGTAPTPQTFAPPPEIRQPKTPKPRIPGLFAVWSVFFRATWPVWHAPCNNPDTTQFRGPWYRQAENPLFTPGVLDANRVALHTAFGNLGTGRPGIPSLTPKPLASPRFGSPGTGRPGTPSFIALGDGSPAASGHPPPRPSTPRATAEPPPGSAASPHRSCARASSHPCR